MLSNNMARDEWYRKADWSPEDEIAFFDRFNRSRASNKSQYLRIQAYHLADAGHVAAALCLLQKCLAEFPNDFQLAAVHMQAAQCHERLGDYDAALNQYRMALGAQERKPQVDPGTRLEYPWFVVMHELHQFYDEALEILDAANVTFPIDKFKAAAVRALVAHSRGAQSQACRHAADALRAATMRESGFRYHRNVGLVGPEYDHVVEMLSKWGAA